MKRGGGKVEPRSVQFEIGGHDLTLSLVRKGDSTRIYRLITRSIREPPRNVLDRKDKIRLSTRISWSMAPGCLSYRCYALVNVVSLQIHPKFKLHGLNLCLRPWPKCYNMGNYQAKLEKL